MNKAKRIVDNMDSENAFAVCSEIGIIDENATPLKQARYINGKRQIIPRLANNRL